MALLFKVIGLYTDVLNLYPDISHELLMVWLLVSLFHSMANTQVSLCIAKSTDMICNFSNSPHGDFKISDVSKNVADETTDVMSGEVNHFSRVAFCLLMCLLKTQV